jgi:hypothetical protein
MMKRLVSFIFYFAAYIVLFGQEFNCRVSILAPQLKTSPENVEIFQALENSLMELINGTKWTNDNFLQDERIDCSFQLTINSKSGSADFSGSIQVSSSRPVYNSSYKTRLFNFNDEKLNFSYQRGEAIIFTPDRASNNLADVVAFYLYMILGYDYDSFSPDGGTFYFNKAQQIVSNCQSVSAPGWKASEGKRSRFFIVDNTLGNVFKPLRECYYKYHREGFDKLYDNPTEAINKIVESLQMLEQIHKTQPNSINVQNFFTAKADELVSLFMETPQDITTKAYIIMVKLDPGNINKYNKLKDKK